MDGWIIREAPSEWRNLERRVGRDGLDSWANDTRRLGSTHPSGSTSSEGLGTYLDSFACIKIGAHNLRRGTFV